MVEANLPEKVKTDSTYRPPVVFDYTIDSARVSARNGLLYIYVQYSGGCRDHQFEAVTDGAWEKSQPPQLTINLRHNNGGDACREQINKTLVYDIKSISYPGAKEIQLRIGTFKLLYKLI